MIGKHKPHRSERWLMAVRSLEYCVMCGQSGVQAAHANQGKGMGMKVSDCLTAALCPQCHTQIDQYRDMTRDEARARMDRAVVLTIEKLVLQGYIKVV